MSANYFVHKCSEQERPLIAAFLAGVISTLRVTYLVRYDAILSLFKLEERKREHSTLKFISFDPRIFIIINLGKNFRRVFRNSNEIGEAKNF